MRCDPAVLRGRAWIRRRGMRFQTHKVSAVQPCLPVSQNRQRPRVAQAPSKLRVIRSPPVQAAVRLAREELPQEEVRLPILQGHLLKR